MVSAYGQSASANPACSSRAASVSAWPSPAPSCATPAILILDEAASSLDSESESLVFQALDRLMEGRTALLIAHRLSTVRSADRICALMEGATVEEGTHDDLLARPEGVYRTLTLLQMEGATEAVGSAV